MKKFSLCMNFLVLNYHAYFIYNSVCFSIKAMIRSNRGTLGGFFLAGRSMWFLPVSTFFHTLIIFEKRILAPEYDFNGLQSHTDTTVPLPLRGSFSKFCCWSLYA